jgi:hypothetical protein
MPLGYLNDPHSYMAYVSLVVHQRSLDTVDAVLFLMGQYFQTFMLAYRSPYLEAVA